MSRRLQTDKVLFGTIVALTLFGALMVFSASAVVAAEKFGSSTYFLIRQLAWAGAGLAALVVLMYVDYRRLASPLVVFTALSFQMLLLVGVLFAPRTHNTHRWLHLGPASLQPSEFAKLVIVLFMAYFLEQRAGKVNDLVHTLLPVGLVSGATMALVVVEPDFGTSLAIAMIVAAMLFVAGLRAGYFAGMGLGAVPVVYWLIFSSKYRYNRMLAFLHPNSDPLGKGFHILQSLIAVGTGGITGVGLMEGKQKLFYLPEPQTDFIFAVVSEELGYIGACILIIAFGIILWRGLRASARCTCEFGRLLAIGLTVMVVGQALVNMSVVLGLLPTKGIPLPLISYGGSSLFFTLAAVGVLLNISQDEA
jgi:cell division protein FtsW